MHQVHKVLPIQHQESTCNTTLVADLKYRIVLNKRSLRADRHPGGFKGSKGTIWRFVSQFCAFLTNFHLF